jgi:hypothetical protein
MKIEKAIQANKPYMPNNTKEGVAYVDIRRLIVGSLNPISPVSQTLRRNTLAILYVIHAMRKDMFQGIVQRRIKKNVKLLPKIKRQHQRTPKWKVASQH